MSQHEKINYLELPCLDIEKTKDFFSKVFSWEFTDYGPEYIALKNAGIDGWFFLSNKTSTTSSWACLIVIYSENLLETQNKIVQANGEIIKPTFSFPGGSRFHFTDPNGNEYAIWNDK